MPETRTRVRTLGPLTVILLLVGCQEANTFAPPPPPTVTVAPPARRDVTDYRDFTGRTEGRETVEVRARVRGYLEVVHFEPSEIVQKGAPLFHIESDRYEADVASAEAELAQRQAASDLAIVTYDRAKAAFDKGAVTDLELRDRAAQRDAAAAAVDAAVAAVDAAKLELSYTEIKAPLTGRISRDYVSVGNLVGVTEPTLLTTIVVDDPIYAYFNADERFILELTQQRDGRAEPDDNDPMHIRLQFVDGSDYEIVGKVDFGENRIDPETGTLQARAVFDNPEGKIFPGMFARIRFPTVIEDAMLVPEIAIQRDLVGPYVLVVDESNIVQRRDVVLGPRVEREMVVESGLDGTERLIVNGLQRAREGIEVQPQTADAAPPSPSSGEDG